MSMAFLFGGPGENICLILLLKLELKIIIIKYEIKGWHFKYDFSR
jgi:hypothetical protein